MTSSRKIHQVYLALAILVTALVAYATPTQADRYDYSTAINLAGKQRMLSQKMAKQSLMLINSIDVRHAKEDLLENYRLFDKTMRGLRFGDRELRLDPIKAPNLIASWELAAQTWQDYAPLIKEVVAKGEYTDVFTVSQIAETNLLLLDRVNQFVLLLEEKGNVEAAKDNQLHSAINLAGRQRMLTQKMAKEFLLVLTGFDTEHNQANLIATMQLFETTLAGLQNGSAELNLPAPPNSKIAQQLAVVEKLWRTYSTDLKRLSSGMAVSKQAAERTIRESKKILYEMDKAVYMYAAVN